MFLKVMFSNKIFFKWFQTRNVNDINFFKKEPWKNPQKQWSTAALMIRCSENYRKFPEKSSKTLRKRGGETCSVTKYRFHQTENLQKKLKTFSVSSYRKVLLNESYQTKISFELRLSFPDMKITQKVSVRKGSKIFMSFKCVKGGKPRNHEKIHIHVTLNIE